MDLQRFPPEVASLPPHVLAQLMDVANEKASPTTIGFFSVPTFVYFCILYICAKTLEASFKRFSVVYPTLTFANQRTCVIYILNTAATTAAFALQMAASPTLASDFSKLGFEYIRICCVLISGLYLFELIYRESLRWPMILHHFSTLAAIFLLTVVLDRTMHPSILVSGLLWLFQATTEQSVFLGLFMYRFHYPPRLVASILYCSAISSMIFKLGFAAYLLAWWGMKQVRYTAQPLDIVYSCFLVLLVVTLMFCQVWGAWVVWKIGRSVEARYNKDTLNVLESTSRYSPDSPGEEKTANELQDHPFTQSFTGPVPKLSFAPSPGATQVNTPVGSPHECENLREGSFPDPLIKASS